MFFSCILRNFCAHRRILANRYVKTYLLPPRIVQYKVETTYRPTYYIEKNIVGQTFFCNPKAI